MCSKICFFALNSSNGVGAWEGLEVSTPYPVSVEFQRQRQMAAELDTVYVYDFLILFQKALAAQWYVLCWFDPASTSVL